MRPAYLRSPEALRRRRAIEEDPRITEARLQLLAQLRLGPKPSGRPSRLLPRVGARDVIEAVEDLRPAG